MGDPRKNKKSYNRPKHPWRMDRIRIENELQERYGLKNKKEIWKAHFDLGKIRERTRVLLSGESGPERDQILTKLERLGIIQEGKTLEDVLELTVENFLDRRLQTIVYRKGLANTIRQSRHIISHGHVRVLGRVVDSPGYLVKKAEEESITTDLNLSSDKETPKEVPSEKEKNKADGEKTEEKVEAKKDNREEKNKVEAKVETSTKEKSKKRKTTK